MFLLKTLLLGAVLPALLSGLLLIAAWRPWRCDAPRAGGAWGGALALGAGYVVGHAGVIGWPSFPPVDTTHWLVYLALAAMALGVCDAVWRAPAWVRWGLRLLFVGATLGLLLRPMLEYTWKPALGAAWMVGLAVAVLAFWAVLDALSERLRGPSFPLTLLVVTLGGSAVLLVSGSALLSQLGGALAATLGASLLVAWWSPTRSLSRGAVPVVGVLLAGLWLNGYFYANSPAASALLLMASPAAAWVGQAERVQRLAPWQTTLVRVAAVFVPVALAVIFAFGAASPSGYD